MMEQHPEFMPIDYQAVVSIKKVQEYMDVITETATMSKDEWVRAYMFSVVLQTFHHLGLTRYFAVYD